MSALTLRGAGGALVLNGGAGTLRLGHNGSATSISMFLGQGPKGDPGTTAAKGDKGDKGDPGPALPADQMAALATTYAPITDANGKAIVRKDELTVNVRDRGAKGDGVTDDRAAIQSSINYLRNGGRTGGVVYLPIGEYRISAALTIPTGITLRGEQAGFEVYATTGRTRIVIDPAVADNVLRNSNAGASTGNAYDANITIENLYIEGPASAVANAIQLRGATIMTQRVLIRDCYVTNRGGGDGIFMQQVQTSEIRSCYVVGIVGNAIQLNNSADSLITGCQLDTYIQATNTVGGSGVLVTGSAWNNVISDNFIFLCDFGVRILSGRGNTITGNRVNTCNYGIFLQGALDNDAVSNNTVVGNTLYDHGYKGTGVTAIYIDGYAGRNTIVGNTSFDSRTAGRTQQYGIRILGNARGNVVAGNVNYNNINAGILNASANANTNSVYGNSDGVTGGFNLPDGQNIVIGSTTGSMIGQAGSKVAFFGSTPVVKPTGTPGAATDAATTQALVNDLRLKLIQLGLVT